MRIAWSCTAAPPCRLHSFCSVSHDRFRASSKGSSPHNAIGYFVFHFQYPLFSLKSTSICLLLHPRLPVTSVLPSICRSVMCFRRRFLRKVWPIQLAFLLFIVGRKFLSSLTLCNISSFQNFPGISDLLSEMSKFQHLQSSAPNVALHQFIP